MMITAETKIRVRYAETDKMGYVYYGNYAAFYEVGRTELMRKWGFSYKDMEEKGFIMPVLEMKCRYIKPAFYDDVLRVKTYINELPESRITFYYEIYNDATDILLNKGETTLVFLSAENLRLTKAPKWFIDVLKKMINH